ncbi:hypothetical protein C7445_102154 [Alicyclobacillus sacchari]|uniref:Uncharacterized protein n=1 Tax=Alicyclobacillus sacchari TaxID=392010 RepID=A0A4R8LUV0_9BACL|nr:hypothetical protein [Alicyclobacillus sacchari]TDY50595.1 hypothetical protein C7445_102154 [Alicyclobacillus sacchari]GMA59149.1 hypothetical protein GCM10025858_36520 [Alicyclobacillus sacchari]
MVAFVILGVALFVLASVFHVGRRLGLAQGRRRAAAEIPLELRATFQLEQRCPICDDEQSYPILSSRKRG